MGHPQFISSAGRLGQPPKSARAKHVRRSVTLPAKIARQVETLARQRDLSDNRVLVELIEQGIEAQQQKEKVVMPQT
jgi:predicted DNA-binding ribbon-helix-helix protein